MVLNHQQIVGVVQLSVEGRSEVAYFRTHREPDSRTLVGLRSDLIVQFSRVSKTQSCGISTSMRSYCSSNAAQQRSFNLLDRETNDVPHPVATVPTYEGPDRA